MIRKIFTLLALAVILSSCAMNAAKNYGEVNIQELRQNEQKYGIVVFKSMFLNNEQEVRKFVLDEHFIELNSSESVGVFAKKEVEDNYGIFYFGYQIGGNWFGSDEEKEKWKRFSIHKSKQEQNENALGVVMSEFFYTVKMLPEGKYYVSRIKASIYDSQYDKKEAPFYFYVKSGHINYLGDLFIFSPEKKSFWTNTYSLSTRIYDKSQQAHEFMNKYHPEINLPFITNLIISNGN